MGEIKSYLYQLKQTHPRSKNAQSAKLDKVEGLHASIARWKKYNTVFFYITSLLSLAGLILRAAAYWYVCAFMLRCVLTDTEYTWPLDL